MIIPGPIVDETVTFLMNVPLAEDGLFFIIASNKDFIFNTPDELMWNQAALSFGISPSEFSGHGGLA